MYKVKIKYMTETLNLTPAEMEMVALKREQDALAKKEADLKKQAELEKSIVAKKSYMDKTKIADNEQITAAKNFAQVLGTGFELKIKTWVEEVNVNDYIDGKYVPVWTDNFTRRLATIVCGGYTIAVGKHITYSNSWSSRGTDHGYKMYLSGPGIDYKYERKALTSTKTVKTKIDECVEQKKREIEYKQKQLSALESTVEKMKTLYPDAIVSSGKDGERTYKNTYETYDAITIKFANGISIKYKVYSDGSLGRKDITFNVKDSWSLMEIMNAVTISESQKTNQ